MTDPLYQPYDDEIELIDIFRILFKWKIFIISGVIIIAIISVAICLAMEKTYRVSMTVQPGIMYSTDEGKRVFIDAIETIVARIDAGIYDKKIIDHALKRPDNEKPEKLELNVEIPKQADLFQVSYDTADPKEGVDVLNELFKLLILRENESVTAIVDSLNRKINIDTLDLDKKKEIELSYLVNVKNIDKRMNELRSDIEIINKNSEYLNDERKKLLSRKTDDQGALSVLLYSNTIQQNIQLINAVKNDLNNQTMLKEAQLQKVIGEKNEQKIIAEIIFKNVKLRDNITRISMLNVPDAGKYPVKPNKRMIVLLSVMAGFFVMIFMSFLLEYIKNNPLSVGGASHPSA